MTIIQKQAKKFAISALAAAITLGISGCSSDDPDEGSRSQYGTVSGTVIDGYVVGATVYLDINENGRKDAGEPYAITDSEGSFTTSKDGVDYCAATATELQQRHCLSAASTGSEVTLRSYGGFDRLTGEPFVGTLSTKVTTVAGGAVADQMISPLTSMLMEVSIEDRADILAAYGLTEEDLDVDFLDSADTFDADALAAALSMHKVVTIFAALLDNRYEELGTNNDFPTNSSSLIYQALAPFAGSLGNAENLEDAFDAAEAAIRALYAADDELTVPEFISDLHKDEAIDNALAALGLIDNIIDDETDFADANGLVLAVEVVVQKMTEDADDIDETIALAEDAGSGLRTLLGGTDDIDFKGLVDTALSEDSDFEDFEIPVDAASFNNLVGRQLQVSYQDEERNGDAYFFFNAANEGDNTGTLNTCLRYQEAGESDDETDGSYLDATWFTIDSRRMVVTLGDGAYNITIISKGPSEFSLSYGGETRTWVSDNGFLDADDEGATTEPTDDASCAALFTVVE